MRLCCCPLWLPLTLRLPVPLLLLLPWTLRLPPLLLPPPLSLCHSLRLHRPPPASQPRSCRTPCRPSHPSSRTSPQWTPPKTPRRPSLSLPCRTCPPLQPPRLLCTHSSTSVQLHLLRCQRQGQSRSFGHEPRKGRGTLWRGSPWQRMRERGAGPARRRSGTRQPHPRRHSPAASERRRGRKQRQLPRRWLHLPPRQPPLRPPFRPLSLPLRLRLPLPTRLVLPPRLPLRLRRRLWCPPSCVPRS